ncbi:hypothetical protein B9T38_09005 [Acinetobacter sp. ANC 4218]|uniref:hypothetical protein n=1 Tax=Acinetobacter sp. ANC 4218 TaxID=1977880 RepID=UPI000A336773|nr:hypothetical protein [Acinetobacter sp. ANC 4218]OTG71401.1 hypothetical protein B9T38_09005 [Acinetobacter sp. ANC 4218]
MKDLPLNILKLFLAWAIAVFLVASYGRSAYANSVHPHDELALVGYEYSAHTVRLMGFFCMRNISMRSHVMAELEGEAFALASHLSYWSTNPFQLCHLNYLVVIGKAPTNSGAH